MKKLTLKDFLEKSVKIHGNKYDYSLVEYKNNKTKVKIICPEHGEFLQKPQHHFNGAGCPICKNKKLCEINSKSKKEFIKDAKNIHGDKYDYTLVEYKNNFTKVRIICPEHGEFLQKPNSHTICKSGCPKCVLLDNKSFIRKSNTIHKNKYDYSLIIIKNNKSKVKIICNEHGIFEQKASSHLEGVGCPKCRNEQVRKRFVKNKLYFIEKAKRTHGDKYDYSLVDYINNKIKVKILCPNHGIFEQTPSNHYKYGCPFCKESQGEKKISFLLDDMKIKYIRQKTFIGCENKQKLHFDFYLPEYNMCIEYDGIQHFKPVDYFGGVKKFLETKRNDEIKNIFCEKNNIKLIRIRYNQNVEKIINKNV